MSTKPASKSEKIKIGIVGTNHISHRLAEAAEASECAEIHAVCSRTAENADRFADIHGIEKRFSDYPRFLKESGVDAVYIAVPNIFHAEYAMQAISHGRHVLCEKPMTCSYAETAALVTAAEQAGVCLMEAMRPAHDPAYNAVRLAIPRLGKLRYARLEFCQYSSRYDSFLSGVQTNTFTPSLGNAGVLDIGVYPLYMCIMLFGKPRSIQARNVKLSNGFDGCGQLTLDYGSMTSDIVYSKVTESVMPSVIMGEMGSLTIDKVSMPAEVKLIMRGQKAEIIYNTPIENSMIFELNDFCHLIKEGGADPTRQVSLAVAEAMDTVLHELGIRFDQ